MDEGMHLEAALTHCRNAIRRGSLSFTLASRLFPARLRDDAAFVYAWCRHCDDEIDRNAGESAARLDDRVSRLRVHTLSALGGGGVEAPEFLAFGHVARRHRIPAHYPLELIEGMAMDARSQRYETLPDLELYCYRVAGTVGLMMTHVMGVQDPAALRNACDLGIAMQLTNIARDVVEDAGLGRLYLPLGWLREDGIEPSPQGAIADRAVLAGLVARLLDLAEQRYHSGRLGIRSLPLSAAFAIAAAAYIYREIGVLVRERGARAWDSRAVVSPARKAWAILRAVVEVGLTVPGRVLRRRPLVPITQVWRHS